MRTVSYVGSERKIVFWGFHFLGHGCFLSRSRGSGDCVKEAYDTAFGRELDLKACVCELLCV